MPEGHTLHRLAQSLDDRFAGRAVRVSSPQGRFADAAGLLDGAVLLDAEAWGKHLFVRFEENRYVHVHLGLYGRFDVHDAPPPPPEGAVRLRLVGTPAPDRPAPAAGTSYADLRGPTTCELFAEEGREAVVARLGPDPLRPDADLDSAWRRIHRSASPIGALLMDQSVLAGVGNVFRAEVLFRRRIHPLRPGCTLRRGQYDALWADLTLLLRRGVTTGRIDTVREEHTPQATGRPPRVDGRGGEVYVYRRHGQRCHVCGSRIRTGLLQGRSLYWCPRCQPRFRSRSAVPAARRERGPAAGPESGPVAGLGREPSGRRRAH